MKNTLNFWGETGSHMYLVATFFIFLCGGRRYKVKIPKAFQNNQEKLKIITVLRYLYLQLTYYLPTYRSIVHWC